MLLPLLLSDRLKFSSRSSVSSGHIKCLKLPLWASTEQIPIPNRILLLWRKHVNNTQWIRCKFCQPVPLSRGDVSRPRCGAHLRGDRDLKKRGSCLHRIHWNTVQSSSVQLVFLSRDSHVTGTSNPSYASSHSSFIVDMRPSLRLVQDHKMSLMVLTGLPPRQQKLDFLALWWER